MSLSCGTLFLVTEEGSYVPIGDLSNIEVMDIHTDDDFEGGVLKWDTTSEFSGTIELSFNTALKLYQILYSKICAAEMRYTRNTIVECMNSAGEAFDTLAKNIQKFLLLEEYEEPELDLDFEKDYDTHLKKYDKFTKSQSKQFISPSYHSKNYPYRRCDRSR